MGFPRLFVSPTADTVFFFFFFIGDELWSDEEGGKKEGWKKKSQTEIMKLRKNGFVKEKKLYNLMN